MKKPSDKPNKFYASILLYLTLSISFTIFIVSIVLYINFESIGRSLIFSSSRDNLSQISYSATFMTDTVKALATQIYFNTDTSKLLYNSGLDSQEINVGLNRLNSYRITMPLVHSIYIYNGDTGTFYSNLNGNVIKSKELFFDQDIIKILDNFDNNKRLVPISRKLNEPYSPADKNFYSNVYTFVFYDIPVQDRKVKKAVILNISEEWMRKTISSLDVNPGSSTFIIDSMGVTICGNRKDMMLSDISEREYIRDILHSNASSGYFIKDVDGVKSLVAYVSSGPFGWKYIRITPYDSVLKRINDMKRTTILISLLILIVGLLFSYLLSKTMYKPIENMLNNLNSLAAEKRRNSFQLKQEFLRGILQGRCPDTSQDAKSMFRRYDINLDPVGSFALILFKIDYFMDFCAKYNFDDRNLFKFGIMNIAAEVCSEKFTNEAVDMEQDHIVLLINLPSYLTMDQCSSINEIIVKIQECIKKHLDISLSVTTSLIESCKIDNLNHLYGEMLEASQYRLFYKRNSIIYTETILKLKSDDYDYPAQKVKLLLDALILGKVDKVKDLYIEIMESTKGYTFPIFNSTILKLIYSINVSIDTVEKTGGIPISYNFNAFIAKLDRLETLEDVNNNFFEMFQHIATKLEERRSSKYDVLVNKIINIINTKYIDCNLSLESMADRFNMSSAYLGRIFKKITSKSVSDYINEVRIEKAKKLLETSNASISEIVEQTGFSSSNYFYIYFKKTNGITPNEYKQRLGRRETGDAL